MMQIKYTILNPTHTQEENYKGKTSPSPEGYDQRVAHELNKEVKLPGTKNAGNLGFL